MTDNSLTVVVPVFNEAQSLPTFLPELVGYCHERGFQLIFVDDASTDESASLIQPECNGKMCRLIQHKVNRGYGGALKTGIRNVKTEFIVTMDADGQHRPQDVGKLWESGHLCDADMVVGRRQNGNAGFYRAFGRRLIRSIAGLLVSLPVKDLNSGMKLYRTRLAQRYLVLCPDSMAFSDIITLVFVHRNNLVTETDIEVRSRFQGSSTITTGTAIDTVFEIINIVALFNPSRIFLPIGGIFVLAGLVWGLPFILKDEGVSVGTMLLLVFGLIFFLVGIIAEQVAQLRRAQITDD